MERIRASLQICREKMELLLTVFVIVIFSLSAVQSAIFCLTRLGKNHDYEYMLSSIVCMSVSGLGIIILLLFKLKSIEKSAAEKREIMDMLLSRMAAVEAAMDGVAITDAAGNLTYANHALAEMNGYHSPDDLIGRTWFSFYDAKEKLNFENNIFPELLIKWRWKGHLVGIKKDGGTYDQDLSLTLLQDGGKVWVVRDNTQTMEYISLAENRLAAIEAAQDGIGIVDSNGRLTYMNQALMKIHGIHSEDSYKYIGKPWHELYAEKGRREIRENVLPALYSQGSWEGEAPVLRKDGTVVYAEMSLTLLKGGGFIGTARDITARKKSETEKEELQTQFFQAQKMEAVGRLAGGIAHDFNNILASISGYSEFLLEDLPPQDKTHGFAAQIMTGCIQAQELVDQILSFSRRGESTLSVFNLADTVRGNAGILNPTVPSGIVLDVNIGAEDASISGNANQVSQALMNICVNAIDAMEGGRGRLSIETDKIISGDAGYPGMLIDQALPPEAVPPVRFYEDDRWTVLEQGKLIRNKSYIRVTIKDTGTGMDREIMEHIFDPFFTTKPVDQGTGLGLSSVHGIVTSHGGAIVVRSKLKTGTEFHLLFPEAETAAYKETGSVHQLSSVKKTGRILLVEDEERVREAVGEMLQRMGYESASCDDGDVAVDHLRENPDRYDLVLSDYTMPRMNGAEMAREIAVDFPGLPVVILSGYSNRRLQNIAAEIPNIKAVLRKPVSRDALAAQLNELLERKKAG